MIAISTTIGSMLYMKSILMIDVHLYSLVVFIVFGGMVPAIMNLRMRSWMSFECKAPNFIKVPTSCGMTVDVFIVCFVVLGAALIINVFWNKNTQNVVAFVLSLLSGLFLGFAMA